MEEIKKIGWKDLSKGIKFAIVGGWIGLIEWSITGILLLLR
jgi:hypothetical protein